MGDAALWGAWVEPFGEPGDPQGIVEAEGLAKVKGSAAAESLVASKAAGALGEVEAFQVSQTAEALQAARGFAR